MILTKKQKFIIFSNGLSKFQVIRVPQNKKSMKSDKLQIAAEQFQIPKIPIKDLKIDDSSSFQQKSQARTSSGIKFKTDTFAESFCLSDNQHIDTLKKQFQTFISKCHPEKKIQILLTKKLLQKESQISLNQHLDQFSAILNQLPFLEKLLNEAERQQFQRHIQRYNLLGQTLKQLYQSFPKELFEQFAYIFAFFYRHFLNYAKQHAPQQFIIPHFPALTSISSEFDYFQLPENELQYSHLKQLQTLKEADKIAVQSVDDLFFSKELRLINLVQNRQEIPKQINIKEQFGKFINILARSVYLCSIQCFEHPDSQQQNGNCLKRWAQVSIFDWSQDLEEIDSFQGPNLKKRKLQ